MKHRWTALTLLLIGCISAYAWQWLLPVLGPQATGHVWNVSGAIYRLALLALVAIAFRSGSVIAVCSLLACFDFMVAGCSLLYLYSPWPILPGQESCSARFNYPLGLLGAVVALVIVLRLVREKS